MSIHIHGTKEALDDLAEEFAQEYPYNSPVMYDEHHDQYYMVTDGEYGDDYIVIDEKFLPVIVRFINQANY